MNSPTPKQLAVVDHLRRTGVLSTVEHWVKRLTAPFYWYHPDRTLGDSVRYTGSMSFVHTGDRLLGISAHHVHKECVATMNADPEVTCQIGGITFDPRDRLIASSRHYDLATYRISEIQLAGAGADFHQAPEWPPKIEAGLMLAGGWLNEFRKEHPTATTHSFLHFIAWSQNVSESQIGIVTQTSTSHAWGDKGLPPGTQLGGMSGGAVYLVREDPLTKIYLVGTIFEYQPGFEIMLARPFTLINSDGTIGS